MKEIIIFPTKVLSHTWPDSVTFNKELKRVIIANRDEDPGVVRSNTNGWHSTDNLLEWDEPVVQDLRARIVEITKEMIRIHEGEKDANWAMQIAAWANINGPGCYNIYHSHPNCVFSGCYYVSTGKTKKRNQDDGAFEFLDPRPTGCIDVKGLKLWNRGKFNPVPGSALMFPAWQWHCVHPFQGKGERISVAFNVNLKRVAQKT